MPGHRVDERTLSRRELTDVAWLASRAFHDDPFFRFLLPRERGRGAGLMLFFRNALRHMGPGGRILTVRDDNDQPLGVAAWLPPGTYPQSVNTQLRQIPGSLRALARRPRALVVGGAYVADVAKHHPKETHWYLYLLAADPSRQRSGVGTALLAHELATIDEQGLGSYLETQKEDNLAYYRRFGYELKQTLRPMPDGPPFYTMWRDPR